MGAYGLSLIGILKIGFVLANGSIFEASQTENPGIFRAVVDSALELSRANTVWSGTGLRSKASSNTQTNLWVTLLVDTDYSLLSPVRYPHSSLSSPSHRYSTTG